MYKLFYTHVLCGERTFFQTRCLRLSLPHYQVSQNRSVCVESKIVDVFDFIEYRILDVDISFGVEFCFMLKFRGTYVVSELERYIFQHR